MDNETRQKVLFKKYQQFRKFKLRQLHRHPYTIGLDGLILVIVRT